MLKRTDGDETWVRLQSWMKGQKAAERLSALVISADGHKSVNPSHPLGGRDSLKDMVCSKNEIEYIVASYFPRSQQRFIDIKTKFIHDFEGVKKNNVDGIVFITNQELTLGERKKLTEYNREIVVEIYHLERISHILNRPENYGIRLEFLDIELSKEESLSYFAYRDNELKRMSDMIEKVMDDYNSFKNKSNDVLDNRNDDEVSNAIDELYNKIWYNRHCNLKHRVEKGENVNPEIWKGALEAAARVEQKYGLENLGPWGDFEWGMMNGKLSALRWFFSDNWDMLDT